MLEFQRTMDPHSLDVVRDPDPHVNHDWNKTVARISWHPGRAPHMQPVHDHSSFTLDEMIEITAELQKQVAAWKARGGRSF
jgi:hypothetical protein